MSLRRRIALDPETFLSHADSDASGDVNRDEFDKLCRSLLNSNSEEHLLDDSLLLSLFRELGPNEDDIISQAESTEMRSAIRLFVKDAGCEGHIVQALMGLVISKARASATSTTPRCQDDKSAAGLIMAELSQLSHEEVCAALGDVLPLSIEMQALKVHELQDAASEKQQSSKFVDLDTAAYGQKDIFDKGLEVLGVPHVDILEKMYEEMVTSDDSDDNFTAWNSGENITFPKKVLFSEKVKRRNLSRMFFHASFYA